LSSGLDSGTVAILAAEELAAQGRSLYTYSHVPLYDSESFLPKMRFGNEQSYVEILCGKYNNIKTKFLDTSHISPVDGIIKSLDLTCQPSFGPVNMFWIHDIRESAAAEGVNTLFTGARGNLGVSFNGMENHSKGLADFIKNINYCKLYHEKSILKALVKSRMPELNLNIIRKNKKDFYQSYSEDWHNFSAVNLDFAERTGIAGIQPQEILKGKNIRNIIFENILSGSFDIIPCLKEKYGVSNLDPTNDKDLVDFCLGIPDEQHQRYGITRFLIRRAFHEKMPKQILWNKSRGKQSADNPLRVKHEYKRIKHILEALRKSSSAPEILNLARMEQVLNRTLEEQSQAMLLDTNRVVLRGLSVGLFLLRNEGDKNEY
ncbi:MAG: asparagine synthase-related protein, partial [Victivallaceae bacterium]|nr:asparagine synthase-related protein [Victivallaceae bacterium]